MKNLNITTVVGWILIVILFGAAVYLQDKDTKQKQKEQAAQKKEQQIQAQKQKEQAKLAATVNIVDSAGQATVDTTVLTNEYGAFGNAAVGVAKDVVIETDLQKITFNTKGGKVKSVELKQYKTWNGKPLILFNDTNTQFTFSFFTPGNKSINTGNFYFETEAPATIKVTGDDTKEISFRLKVAEGKYFEQKYTVKGNNYLMDYEVNVVGLGSVLASNTTNIQLDWKSTLPKQEHVLKTERGNSALYFKYKDSDVGHLDETKEKEKLAIESSLEWISFKQQFFNSTIFYKDGFNQGKLSADYADKDTGYVKAYVATTFLPYNSANNQSYKFSYYFGPNHYNTLKKSGPEFESILKLGYDFFLTSWIKYINKWFIIPVFNFFERMHLGYGLIILLMTLILKIVLHPFTAKSFRSAAMMKILTPELTALKEKYGDDQARLGQEQMKLYQRAGVSPLGGCLPMLFQMPILMAMYFFFPNSIELRQEHFLWVKDLSSYDSIITFAQPLPLIGIEHISLMTILLTVTSIIQAVMNSNMNAMNNQQPGMKYLPYIMPIMLMFIFNSFAAALTYYYLLQNVLGIAQQWIMQKFFIDEEKLRKQIEENKKNPKQKSGWMKKLEDAQKQAEARAREAQKPASKKK